MSNTAAIVVTYNRKELLKKNILALRAQTYPVDIIIIDNMSTDGTSEMLKPMIDNKEIIYFRTTKNVGGAGGFYEGIKLAYKLGYEYFWLMDDDCIPTPDSIKELIGNGKELNDNYGFLSSKVLWKNNSICKMNIPKINLYKKVNDFSKKIIPIHMGTFVSFLTRRSVVENVGLPIKEFFIWGDDVEYSQRISQKYPSYLITSSVVHHETKENTGSNVAIDDYSRIGRYKLAYRNEVVLYRHVGIKGKIYQFIRLGLHSWRVLTKAPDHKKDRLETIIKGTKEGLDFNPPIKYLD